MKTLGTLFTLFLPVVAFAGSASTPEQGSVWITDATIISPENLDHIGEGQRADRERHHEGRAKPESENASGRTRDFR